MTDVHSMIIITVVAAVTMLLRFLPFAVFGKKKKHRMISSIFLLCCLMPLWECWLYIV